MEYKKYSNKVETYRIREGLVIAPKTNSVSIDDYITEFKNKIFVKVRKLNDSYLKFDNNIIFVEVVTSNFFKERFDVEKMNEELNYYSNYIEANFNNIVAKVVIKVDNRFIEYNLSEKSYSIF